MTFFQILMKNSLMRPAPAAIMKSYRRGQGSENFCILPLLHFDCALYRPLRSARN